MNIKQLRKVIEQNQTIEISTMDYYSKILYIGIVKEIPKELDNKIVGVIGAIKNPSHIIGSNSIYISVEV